ncbi:hypothetical protein KAR91_72875 [Candidatus Pacearchaeota archaeon]|nr:hypothetical protein [Candidatus Pacearchaeota archaeon]
MTVTSITQSGVDTTAALVAADAGGDTIASASGLMFRGTNTDTSSHTITISAPTSTASCPPFGTVSISDLVITLPANTGDVSFTVPAGYTASGLFTMAYDAVTNVSIGVFSLA